MRVMAVTKIHSLNCVTMESAKRLGADVAVQSIADKAVALRDCERRTARMAAFPTLPQSFVSAVNESLIHWLGSFLFPLQANRCPAFCVAAKFDPPQLVGSQQSRVQRGFAEAGQFTGLGYGQKFVGAFRHRLSIASTTNDSLPRSRCL